MIDSNIDNCLETIMPPREQKNWLKLDDIEKLALLHQRFWLQGHNRDKLLNDHDQGPFDEDEEVDFNCFVLDLGIPYIFGSARQTKIWVRKEYIRIYKHCIDHLETNQDTLLRSMVITGQPGIGKSYWIFYALCRRLAEKRPTILYTPTGLYIFVTDGVYMSIRPEPSSIRFKTPVLTLVDADSEHGVPGFLTAMGNKYLVAFATSPKKDRWGRLTHTMAWAIVYMNPWTRKEISNAAPIYGFAANDLRIDDMYNQYGPTPRICFEYSKSNPQLEEHKVRFEEALSQLSHNLNALERMAHRSFGQGTGLTDEYGHTSHTILLVRRGEEWYDFTLGFITPTAEMAVRDRLRREVRADQLRLYHLLANTEASRGLAGVVYESRIQEDLQSRSLIQLDLIPMARRGGKSGRWYCNHDGVVQPSVHTIERTGTDSFESALNPIVPAVYYSSKYSNQAEFDSFIWTGGKLFIFRFTIGPEHDIKQRILTFFPQDWRPPWNDWYFVFVVPSTSSELSCSHKNEMDTFMNEINMCSARMDPNPITPAGAA